MHAAIASVDQARTSAKQDLYKICLNLYCHAYQLTLHNDIETSHISFIACTVCRMDLILIRGILELYALQSCQFNCWLN